jgi:hypothetical protein
MSNKEPKSIDKILNDRSIIKWEYDTLNNGKVNGSHYIVDTKQLKQSITTLLEREYRKGYNDNARDCYCDSPGVTDGVLPHHHLMDDGKSHNIRPDIMVEGDKQGVPRLRV